MQDEKTENLSAFAVRLKSLMERRKIRPRDLVTELGVRSGNVSGWRAGDYFPKTELRPKLANLLGVSESFLIHGIPERTSDSLTGYLPPAVRLSKIEEPSAPFGDRPMILLPPGSEEQRPIRREDLEHYFARFLDEAEKSQTRLGWAYEELRDKFPLTKWSDRKE